MDGGGGGGSDGGVVVIPPRTQDARYVRVLEVASLSVFFRF